VLRVLTVESGSHRSVSNPAVSPDRRILCGVSSGSRDPDQARAQRLLLDDGRWVEFVRSHPDAGPFHDPAWALLLAECYDLTGFVVAATDDSGAIKGGIPVLGSPRFPGRPRRLVSLPFTDNLEPLVDPVEAQRFCGAADALRSELGFARIELRGPLDGARAAPEVAVIHQLELAPDPDEVERGFTKMRRRNVRTAERRGLTIGRAQSERDVTETFYGLHLQTRRRLGVPSQPKRFFRLLWRRVLEPGGGFGLIVRRGPLAVAGGIFLVGRGVTIHKYGASDARYQADCPNDLLLSSAIRDACRDGSRIFDFGRSESTATGLRAFKSGWGAAEKPLVYATIGPEGHKEAASSDGVVGSVLRRAPTWVTRAVGEVFYRYAA
jgi:CelD/BcsL family acetyltransferase involved in cellulose biosynthesis